MPEPGNVDGRSPELFITLMTCSPISSDFKTDKMRLAYKLPSSLRAINNSEFTLMGTVRKMETKQIYGKHTERALGFCIYGCPRDTKHTNHPGKA